MKHSTDLRSIGAFVSGLKTAHKFIDDLFEYAAESENPEMEGELYKLKASLTYFSGALDPRDISRQRQSAEWARKAELKRLRELRKEAKSLID